MISIKYFLDKIKDVKIKDIGAVIPMSFALVVMPFFRRRYSGAWLICEEPQEARDNGYHFFKYMCEKQPQQKCFYAIKHKSVDSNKVTSIGSTIEFGSLQHWLAYFLCDFNISSQKGGKPNAALCAFLELNHLFRPHNIFLQHGVIINDLEWLYADRSCFDLFITSTVPEKEFIENKFGYPKGTVVLTGLPRFDNLHHNNVNTKQIVIMPTWRYWFNLKSKQIEGLETDFSTSEYYLMWKELLENDGFNRLIDENDLKVIFYPHRNMQQFVPELIANVNTKVIIADWKDYDIQELLKSSSMMITDYSSVFFDMIYMKKPVLFYQFDLDKFRQGQYAAGYFDYRRNPFGKSVDNTNELIIELNQIIKSGFVCSSDYLREHQTIFPYYDANNSERVFESLVRLRSEKGRVN